MPLSPAPLLRGGRYSLPPCDLAPILSWIKDDLATSGDIDRMYRVSPPTFPTKWFNDVSDPMLKQSPLVPLRKLPIYRETDSQIVLNIYTDGPMGTEQRMILDTALHTWEYDGHEDGFTGAFIAWLGFPAIGQWSEPWQSAWSGLPGWRGAVLRL